MSDALLLIFLCLFHSFFLSFLSFLPLVNKQAAKLLPSYNPAFKQPTSPIVVSDASRLFLRIAPYIRMKNPTSMSDRFWMHIRMGNPEKKTKAKTQLNSLVLRCSSSACHLI